MIWWNCKVKPSISSHSKFRTMPRTRLLKCFVLITLWCKTKDLRSLIRNLLWGFWLLDLIHHYFAKIDDLCNLPFFIHWKENPQFFYKHCLTMHDDLNNKWKGQSVLRNKIITYRDSLIARSTLQIHSR